jgi:SAM-dependent methyltransferase
VRGLAAVFGYAGVVAAYRHRPPYPAEVFDVLGSLLTGDPRWVLDLGAGEGRLARPLAERADRVDAVEVSQAMVDAGRRRPGGGRANLEWIVGPAESAPLAGPYALVTAGASFHWMAWDVMLSRIGGVLAPGAVLAIVDQSYEPPQWQDALADLIMRHSRSPGYNPAFCLPAELERRGLFEIHGQHETTPAEFRQDVTGYVEQFHSTSSLARELMSRQEATDFDTEVRDIVGGYARDGVLRLSVSATLFWGRPVRQAGGERAPA